MSKRPSEEQRRTLGRGKAVKGDSVFKRTFNKALDDVAAAKRYSPLGSENDLAHKLGVSRTTVRKVLAELGRRNIVTADGVRTIVRRPRKADYFLRAETVSTAAQVEKKFMEWLLRDDRKPGDYINGLELARHFGVSTSGIREYLNRFNRFGLIEKRQNASWVFRGFTSDFALELFEVRELFEIRSAIAFAKQPRNAESWKLLNALESEHHSLLLTIDRRYHDFSDLDERFHRLLYDASKNRFVTDFYDIISLIFHYHYQWNKIDEKERNYVALHEHLEYIEALRSRDVKRVVVACKRHLSSARKTLLASIAPQDTG
jgi:DNA-binding GntR family transcriptional regulator